MASKIIIDTDPGVDDAFAILMILNAHTLGLLNVIAIFTCHGNTSRKWADVNIMRILDVANNLQIPVYSGCSAPLVKPKIWTGDRHHGHDGFGGANENVFGPPKHLDLIKSEHASTALLRLLKMHPGEVTLLAIGPLTNLAVALQLDPECLAGLKDFYIMGGNIKGVGNTQPGAEFNFNTDAEAARVVLERANKMIKLVPLETCYDHGWFSLDEAKTLMSVDSPVSSFAKSITQDPYSKYGVMKTFDEIAASWMLDEMLRTSSSPNATLAQKTEKFFGIVETEGSYTRGQLVLDHLKKLKKEPNLEILTEVNMKLYRRYLRFALHWKDEDFPWDIE